MGQFLGDVTLPGNLVVQGTTVMVASTSSGKLEIDVDDVNALSIKNAAGTKTVFNADTVNGKVTFSDLSATPLQLEISQLGSGNYPRTYMVGGQDATDINWGVRFAHKDSSSTTEIPVIFQVSTNGDSNYTNADTLSFASYPTMAFVSTSSGSSGNGQVLYLGTHATATSCAIKINQVSSGQSVEFSTGVALNSAVSHAVTTVNTATYDLATDDYYLGVSYTATGAVTSLTLLTAQMFTGRTIVVKDTGGNAGTNNITIDTEGAETIDGSSTYVISTTGGSVRLFSDGSNWFSF